MPKIIMLHSIRICFLMVATIIIVGPESSAAAGMSASGPSADYGGCKGLVTMEDAVETLLGMEIVDEMDRVEDMQALARQQWEKRAGAQAGGEK